MSKRNKLRNTTPRAAEMHDHTCEKTRTFAVRSSKKIRVSSVVMATTFELNKSVTTTPLCRCIGIFAARERPITSRAHHLYVSSVFSLVASGLTCCSSRRVVGRRQMGHTNLLAVSPGPTLAIPCSFSHSFSVWLPNRLYVC